MTEVLLTIILYCTIIMLLICMMTLLGIMILSFKHVCQQLYEEFWG